MGLLLAFHLQRYSFTETNSMLAACNFTINDLAFPKIKLHFTALTILVRPLPCGFHCHMWYHVSSIIWGPNPTAANLLLVALTSRLKILDSSD